MWLCNRTDYSLIDILVIRDYDKQFTQLNLLNFIYTVYDMEYSTRNMLIGAYINLETLKTIPDNAIFLHFWCSSRLSEFNGYNCMLRISAFYHYLLLNIFRTIKFLLCLKHTFAILKRFSDLYFIYFLRI